MQKLNKIHENKIILDIGGQIYSTTKSTLCLKKESMFAKMFSGYHNLAKLENGAYFIDADGTYFGYILNYLRGRIQYASDLPENRGTLLQLKKEADFYNLNELMDLINVRLSKSDSIDEKWKRDCLKLTEANTYETIKEMHLERCDFSNSSFKKINFLHKAYFEDTDLTGVTFSNCVFNKEVSFQNSELVKAKFIKCKIRKSLVLYFDGANLEKCSFGEKDDPFSKIVEQQQQPLFQQEQPRFLNFAESVSKRTEHPLENYIETMSFQNARNIEKAYFPDGKLEIIMRRETIDNHGI